jgi:hypothetical protein
MRVVTVRDLVATARATAQYEERARILFTLEDRYRRRGMVQKAANCHWAAAIAGHAARAEMVDAEPR